MQWCSSVVSSVINVAFGLSGQILHHVKSSLPKYNETKVHTNTSDTVTIHNIKTHMVLLAVKDWDNAIICTRKMPTDHCKSKVVRERVQCFP